MSDDILNRAGFARRLEPLADELIVFARRVLHCSEDTEDTLQSAFASAWGHRGRFVIGTSFRAWIFRFVVQEAWNANRRRSRANDRLTALAEETPEHDFWTQLEAELAYTELLENPAALRERLDQELAAALERITANERTVLLLRAIAGLGCGEIAEALEVPKGTVLARLFRARVKVRRWLGGTGTAEVPKRSSHGRSAP